MAACVKTSFLEFVGILIISVFVMAFGAIYKISLFLENAFHKMHHWVGIFKAKMLRKGYKNKTLSIQLYTLQGLHNEIIMWCDIDQG